MEMSRNRRAEITGPFVLALLMAAGLPEAAVASNFLVVILDDVGVDKIAAYDRARDPARTPNIDALARSGVLFRNAWANPSCSPSRASALTGRRPELTGLGAALPRGVGLSSEENSLAKMLRRRGYATAAIGKWHMGKAPNNPLALGFDTHRGTRNNIGPDGYQKWRKVIDGVDQGWQTSYATTDAADDAIAWIEAQQSPWFVWLGFHAVHRPLHVPPARLHSYGFLKGSGAVTHYKAILEALDAELGRVLVAAGPDTTIIIMADNGTYPIAVEPPFDPDHGKGTTYEGSLNVPLIVAGPGVADENRGTESNALVHVCDIFATVAELANSDASAEDSVSFVPQLIDANAPGRTWLYTSGFRPNGGPPDPREYIRASRGPRYKLLRQAMGKELLFDLLDDPYEQTNLLEDPLEPSAAEARNRLAAVIDSHGWGVRPASPEPLVQSWLLTALALSTAAGLLFVVLARRSSADRRH
jgi:arylsulfatase A-like enzyme